MAYIAPNSTVYLCRKVPFKNDYQHTTIFDNATAQYNYFYSKRKYAFTEQSYQRKDNGVIRLNVLSDNIIDCNYMMFRNTNFSDKWFYAFITNVEYVNNSVSNVYYEIDVMQTWLFNYNLRQCFVEREHSVTDAVGDNRITENFTHEPFYFTPIAVPLCPFNATQGCQIVICHGVDRAKSGGRYLCLENNVFSGIKYEVYFDPSAAYQRIVDINSAEGTDGILAVLQLPNAFNIFTTTDYTAQVPLEITTDKAYISFDGYVPKNNKLFTQEFYGLHCISSSGTTKEYPFEYFNGSSVKFKMFFSIGSCQPIVALYPVGYKGTGLNCNMDEGIFCDDFVFCSYSSDAFKAYLALNKGSIVSSGITGFAQIGAGAAQTAAEVASPMYAAGSLARKMTSGGKFLSAPNFSGVGNILGGVSTLVNAIGAGYDAYKMPNKLSSGQGNGLSASTGEDGFRFCIYHITKEDAERIDKYFDMFGYACNTVKIPNTYSRPHWNYVKTKNCLIYSTTGDSIPCDDVDMICGIYNQGITFWKNPDEVGQYNLDNRPA